MQIQVLTLLMKTRTIANGTKACSSNLIASCKPLPLPPTHKNNTCFQQRCHADSAFVYLRSDIKSYKAIVIGFCCYDYLKTPREPPTAYFRTACYYSMILYIIY